MVLVGEPVSTSPEHALASCLSVIFSENRYHPRMKSGARLLRNYPPGAIILLAFVRGCWHP
jgi:hypothetical protein